MAKKRRYSISASDDDTIPVLACFDKKSGPAKKTFLSVLACNSCNTQVLANNFAMPFCPCCASDDMSPVSDDLMERSKDEVTEMKQLAHCNECDTVIASPATALASLDDNHLYCPSCSSLAKTIVADEDDEEDSNTDDENETVDEDTDTLFNNDEDEGSSDDTQSGDTNSDDTTNEDDNSSADSADDGSADTTSEETKEEPAKETPSLNANLVKFMSGKEGVTSVVASPDRSKWYLFVDNVPVATASKESASDNVQSMFSTDKFVTAWQTATADGVTEDTLGDFGFTAINATVPVDEAVKQTVEAAIEEGRKEFNMTARDISQRLQRCFGIAAVGINKNVFKEENPIKESLVASLSQLRVRNSGRLVSEAFSQYGEQYLKNIALKASELMEKSDETLDDLADTVDEAKYEKTETTENTKPSVVSLFPVKETEETVTKDKKVEIAASDVNDPYVNILSGASLRA